MNPLVTGLTADRIRTLEAAKERRNAQRVKKTKRATNKMGPELSEAEQAEELAKKAEEKAKVAERAEAALSRMAALKEVRRESNRKTKLRTKRNRIAIRGDAAAGDPHAPGGTLAGIPGIPGRGYTLPINKDPVLVLHTRVLLYV
eukprot:1176246-Prorocentrum_minimum.AAC.1